MDSKAFGNAMRALADWKDRAPTPASMAAEEAPEPDDGDDDIEDAGEARPAEDLGLGQDQFDPGAPDSDAAGGGTNAFPEPRQSGARISAQ